MSKLTHVDEQGRASMVDVGDKPVTKRIAEASARVVMKPETLAAIKEGGVKKGDVLAAARIAGIQAAKMTPALVPLAHPVPIDQVEVEFVFEQNAIMVRTRASATARTGVEMEALCAAAGAALCIYDMAKAIDRGMVVTDLMLTKKSGGRSRDWDRTKAVK